MRESDRSASITNHRRVLLLAAAICFAGLWVAVAAGEWRIGVFVAAGAALGVANLVLAERSLLASVGGDDGTPNRKQFALISLVRLMTVTVVALALSVLFWPLGATALVGLAAFHLLMLVLTGIPLVKELRKA